MVFKRASAEDRIKRIERIIEQSYWIRSNRPDMIKNQIETIEQFIILQGDKMTDTEKELLLTLLQKWHAEESAKRIEVMNTDVIDSIVALGLKLKGGKQ